MPRYAQKGSETELSIRIRVFIFEPDLREN